MILVIFKTIIEINNQSTQKKTEIVFVEQKENGSR